MTKEILARGQATIIVQQDPYSISQSVSTYIFTASTDGTIPNAVSFSSTLKVSLGNTNFTNFTIGNINKPSGFSGIAVNDTNKTITYSIAASTTNLADNGYIIIPVIIDGTTYNISFNWSKSKTGLSGTNGNDGYTVKSSRQGCSIVTDKDGKIHTPVTVSTSITALKGNISITPVIGVLPNITGCTLSKSGTTVTIVFAEGTSLVENGIIDIPVTVNGQSFNVSFSYAKSRAGANGATGADANMLDWVQDWNTNKTVINSNSVITPKLFAGIKNSNGTLTGTAMGRFSLSILNTSGSIVTETIDGIYGFKDGYKTFSLDNSGNVGIGRGNQLIRYNAVTGKIEFGSEVSLNWINAIDTAKTEAINSAAVTAQSKADAAKSAAISAAATDAANKVSALEIGSDNVLPNGDFSNYSINNSIGWDNALNGTYVMSDWGSGYNSGVPAPSTGYHAHLNLIKFGFPVLELANKNSIINLTKRWLGINVPIHQKERLVPGATYTFSADLMTDTLGPYIHGGVHGFQKGQTAPNFNSGQYTLLPTAINKWERVSYTFTLNANADLTKLLTFYIYSRSGPEGICWVKNVSLQRGTKGSWVRCTADVAREVADAKQAGMDAKDVADAITNKANNEGWSTKLTYIGSTGIFTGTLSANTVNAININASQIIAGTINAARIDTASLKATLITAGNIEALTLNVIKGKIGGWSLDSDSIFKGTKNNTPGAYTAVSGSITLGSNGIRGFKWRFDSTGAGAVAGGNIAWDAAGNVTFGASVVLNWTTPINSITTALGGALYPKLTQISATGIYTGTITATQINAGTISVDRIAAGSITASKLNAASIKADIINVNYINGLSCAFTKGTIGGWMIAAGSISNSHIILDNTNRRIAVYGATSSSTTGQRVQLYYNSDSDYGLFATDASGTCIASLGSTNRIAGWIINTSQIYKNNVSLGNDGSISNGKKWKLNNDGSGQLASGNISWNTSGVVTFSPSVSLAWTNDATSKAEAAKELASAMAFGRMLNRDPTFSRGDNGTNIYNNSRNGMVTIIRQQDNSAPNDSKYVLLIRNKGLADPHCGGFYFATNTSYRKIFITRIIAKIPVGRNISFHTNSMGTGGSQKWLTPTLGTGDWCEYICKVKCGTSSFSSTHFFALTGNFGSESAPVDWILSYATVFDVTSTEKYTTTIDSEGIYTASLNANQIIAGTISADRIAAGSIKAIKLDANSIKSQIINTAYINGLNCTFSTGTIGGWSIGADHITKGVVGAPGTIPIQIRSVASGSGYWYQGSYKPYGITMTWNQNGNAGHIVFGQIASSGSSVKTGFIGIQMMGWDNTEYFCLSANYKRSGSKETYNRIAGWAFDNIRIWKNNVSLGSDGSISNGAKWQLNNDGSGSVASGKITWDAAGRLTFSSSVSLLWTNAANRGKLFARGTGLNHNSNRRIYLNGNLIVSSSTRGLTLTIIKRSDLTVVSSNNYDVYGNDTNCNILAAALNALNSEYITVLTSNDAISINQTLNTAIQRCGGSDLLINSSRNPYVLIGIPTIGKDNGLVAVYGIDATEPYAEISTVIFNGTPQGMNVFGKQKTYIDGNGIYTGTLSAGQVRVDTALVVGGSSYNGSISVRDAGNVVKVTLDRSGITAVGGRIGGWVLSSTDIHAAVPITGHRIYLTNNGYLYNSDGSKDYWGLKPDGSAVFGYGKISFEANGSGFVANGNISWDAAGNVQAKNAIFNNVRIQGSVRNKFVLNDSSIWIGGDSSSQENFNNYDNIIAVRGSWDENIALPWTLEQSGRRIILVNYKWRTNTTVGFMTLNAPSGKYFYEDGISKTSIRFSREFLELIGYGDDQTFFGWIVMNRRDIMTSSKYGSLQYVLAQGIVNVSGTSVSVRSNTFDGKTVSVTRTGVGSYNVYLPWNLDGNYFVQATGYYTTTPIYVTITGIYSSYFSIQTQDDSTANEGSFNFQVFSTASWGM